MVPSSECSPLQTGSEPKNLVKLSSAIAMSLTETIKWSSLLITFFPQEFIFNIYKEHLNFSNNFRSSQINTQNDKYPAN